MNLDNSLCKRNKERSPLVCLYVLAYTAKGVSCFYSLTQAVQSLSVESKQAHTFFLCLNLKLYNTAYEPSSKIRIIWNINLIMSIS